MTEEEYKEEWLAGLHNTDYNNCRFSENKIQFGINWIKEKIPSVNIENPQNIIDRINWCKLYDKDFRKPLWANKIWAHNELMQSDLKDILIQPAYIFNTDKFTKEMFDQIPKGKWFFRCNHGSGWNLRYDNTIHSNPKYLLEKLNEWLSLDYSYLSGWEWQYNKMPKGIIVQPDLGQLKDWSFWCENGEIIYVQTSRKLGKNLAEFMTFTDKDGNVPNAYIGVTPIRFKLLNSELNILEKMKPIVKRLASNFKFVRVDLYSINGQVEFSELTFSPCSGKLELHRCKEII